MTYTFDDQLTTDQKLVHLQEWLDSSERALADAAPGGSRPDKARHKAEEERLYMLRAWQRLVQVEEELAGSKADLDDPDPFGDRMQEAWCRMTRIQLRLGGVHLQLSAEQAKPAPSRERIERLRDRMHTLFKKLSIAQERVEHSAIAMIADERLD